MRKLEVFHKRVNPWFYEKDGSLNLGWVLAAESLHVGLLIAVMSVVLANTVAMVASLSYCVTVTIALLITAVPIAKAKILANSEVLKVAAQSIQTRPYGGSTEQHDDGTL